jgi:exopolysaccharide production protein ExoY
LSDPRFHIDTLTTPTPSSSLNSGFVRRLLDIIFASLILSFVWPIILVVAIGIRLKSPGPLFFSQIREGQGGRRFRIWKIRTMHTDADLRMRQRLAEDTLAEREWRTTYCLRRDPRIAGELARLARKYSVDELPQLWNVLTGDMALIGPRPLEPDLAAVLLDSRTRQKRLSVKPGLTGLWQTVRREKSVTTGMVKYDIAYVDGRSLWLDLQILLRTPFAVLSGRG